MGYIYNGGSVWTEFYVNGGTTSVNTSDPNIMNILVTQTGVWKNVTMISNGPVTDDITCLREYQKMKVWM